MIAWTLVWDADGSRIANVILKEKEGWCYQDSVMIWVVSHSCSDLRRNFGRGQCYWKKELCVPMSIIDAFKLWCWRQLLRVPWTASRSNQSILKEIRPGCSLEGLMLKLKLQYFGHLMWRVDSLEKTLMLGGIGGRRRREWQRMKWLDGITDLMNISLSEIRVLVLDREAWRAAIHGVAKSRTWLGNWTELNWSIL